MTYDLKPDTMLRIYKGNDYFERTWLEVQWSLRTWAPESVLAVAEFLEECGNYHFSSSDFNVAHPDAITEID